MKTKDKKNCPRLANAIKRACIYAHEQAGWWTAFCPKDLGGIIFSLAYEADKYDVLNELCPGVPNKIATYARSDIRHKHIMTGCTMVFVILVLLVFYVLKHVKPC
jgi:hypothetical protein